MVANPARVPEPKDHRVHGMGTEWEAPTWPAITPDEAAAVLAHFPAAGAVTGLHWHSPRPFSAATLVQTTRGAFLLKRHHHHVRTREGLGEEHAFIAHLAASGLSVPDVLRAADGASAVAVGDWSYELHHQSPGADLYRDRLSWTPFLSRDHGHAAGVALAELHVAARGFDAPARRQQPLVASFGIVPATDPIAAASAYVAARPEVRAFLAGRSWQAACARLFDQAGADLPTLMAQQPPLWTHNDWHPSNLLWGEDGSVRTAIDFGLADRTTAVHDIATAIERTAIRWLDLGQGNDDAIADPASALALLDGYATIVPLGRADVDAIVRLLPLVHLEFALSEVDYFTAVLADPASAAMAWDGYLIAHADWFFAPPGRRFLRGIERA